MKNIKINFALHALIIGLLLTFSHAAQAATYTVDRTDDATVSTCTAAANDCTLRGAIAAANGTADDDNIEFDAAVFNAPQTITLAGAELRIEGNGTLTINSAGVSGITVSGGDGTTNTNGVFFIGNRSTSQNVTATINKLTIRNGRSFEGGGISMFNSVLTLINSTVSGNTSFSDGGGISGGGVLIGNNVTVSGNTASGNGGGIFNRNYPYILENSIVSDNTATNGGGIYEEDSISLGLRNLTVSGNTASGNGGGIWTTGSPSNGAAFSNINISNNKAGGDGGGFFGSYVYGLNLNLCTISGNTAADDGGGIYQEFTGVQNRLIDSTVSNNTAGGDGGGVFINDRLEASNSTISGNRAGGNGGGLAGDINFLIQLLQSTVSGNAAQKDGGGMFLAGYQAQIESSTFSGNSASRGGGIFSDAADPNSSLTLNNTIIANSTAGGDCFRLQGTINASYSLIEDGLGCINDATNGNNLTGDPNLAPLTNNGGRTQTHALLPGSIAIDAGFSTLRIDQRGSMRPVNDPNSPNGTGNLADIGAFEVQAPTAASVSIGGRVMVGKARGLTNAMVYLTDAHGSTRAARTSAFGYFRFDDIAAGQTVIVTITSKRYQFAPQVVSVAESIADLNFLAESQN